ncbi:uncharacterized protein LOC135702092 [Ochlerotatus camptorhynchus]|uniref:uncharacterized protein LOC135702092 n=1 Tax=Ochlerotatus camptorhynchus TaxID=644619 RepID=UPI0031D95E4E
MGWQRPSEPTIPTVWYTFQAKDPDNGDQLATYRVEDLTEDRYDDMVRHYTENFVKDEPLSENKQLFQDELSMAEITGFWQWCFEQKMTIVCYKEGSDEIVGANLLHVKQADDNASWDMIQSKKIHDIIAINEYMTDQCSIFKNHNVDRYLTAYGLAINHRYRGRGIATEILKARIPLCRAFGIRVTATNFTAIGSQKAAEKVGFKSDLEVTYDDFAKMGPRYAFPGIKSKSLNLMSLIIE